VTAKGGCNDEDDDMTRQNWIGCALAGLTLMVAAGCADDPAAHRPYEPCNRIGDHNCDERGEAKGSLTDAFGTTQFGNATIGSGEPLGRGTNVNKHLWMASLDTLSFLPIASTDPFTGVIATDWSAAPNTPNERLKVTAFVKDTSLTAESLRVAVFREELSENGVWVTAPVDSATPRQLEDAILTRARQLRREELAAKDG
jgi:hypothetical protein